MISQEMIARINELSKKQRSIGLNEAEQEEQAVLRRQYLDNIKAQVRSQIETAPVPHVAGGSCGCGCQNGHKH